jgi:hypothetical protein
MAEGTGILPGLPAVAGKPVHIGFDGGLMTSDTGYCCWRGSSSGSESRRGWPIASRAHARRNGCGIRSPR